MFAKYIVKILILRENKIVAATCKRSALRSKKVVLALADFSGKINYASGTRTQRFNTFGIKVGHWTRS